jgi:large subunit ribosomal protein L4
MKVNVVDQKGKSVKQKTLKDEVFKVDVNDKILAQYVYVYLANQRQSNAHSKIRSEVSGGGRKPHKQKGTGRARSGSSRNPLWTGGGVIFGPRSDRNWKKKITKKFKQSALKNALSKLMQEKKLHIVNEIKIKEGDKLTSQADKMLGAIDKDSKKMLIVTDGKKQDVMNAFSNLAYVKVVSSGEVNVYDLMTGGTIIFEESVIDTIEDKFKSAKTQK